MSYPKKPYNNEITIGRVAKDLFYYFKKFNDTTNAVTTTINNISSDTTFKNQIIEVTKQEVLAADVIEASAVFAEDLQIERLETNIKSYKCIPNLVKTGD